MIRTHTTPPRRPSRPAGVPMMLSLALLLAPGGCGPSARPADPGEARRALLAALDAWKGGEKPDALARRSPPVHAADGDWKSGLRLQGYRAEGEGRPVGSDLHFAVALELKDARGKALKKDAVYAVATHPRVLVLRQDE